MITLLLIPIVIESIMRGVMVKAVMMGIMLMAWSVLAKGELSAMAWLPAIAVLVWTHRDGPTLLPP
jgi:uncharacterized membrane protein